MKKRNEFKKLLNTIKTNWRIAVVVIIMMGISGYILASYGMEKHYITTTDIYIESIDSVTPSEKAAMAALLFSSPRMYDSINEKLQTRFSYAELEKMITVTQTNGTQIVNARFDCRTSSESYNLAVIYTSLVQDVLDSYSANAAVKIVSVPVEPQKPAFPDDMLFTAVGAAIGAFIVTIGIIIIWKLDNTITSADNITEQYGVPVIGELMDFDNEIDYLGR